MNVLKPDNRNVQLVALTVLIPLFLIQCSSPGERETTHPETLNAHIELTEIFSIGGNSPADPNYLLGSVGAVSADENDYVYLSENFGHYIKVFDDQGKFLNQIGRQGDGPGEFRMILTMSLDRTGNLLVMDQSSGSVSTFSSDGRYIDQYPMPNPQIRQIEPLDEKTFLAVYSDPDSGKVLHTFSHDFKPEESFVRTDEIKQTDERFEEVITRFLPGRFLVYDENTVYFTPVFYDGIIHQYRKENEGWIPAGTLNGYTTEPAFEPADPESSGAYVLNLGNEVLAAHIHNESRGLFRTSGGNIIHFTSTRQSGTKVFGAELFSAEGTFLGYTPFQKQEEGDIYALYIDRNDNVYISDQTGETVLRKYMITISHNSNG